jgi:dihydrofolate synthase / folylpolyglutamate synthase
MDLRRLPAVARLESLSPRGMKLGLASIDAVCERLGRPERRFASVLVAGTNGKGSTAATLSAIAHAAGLRAGLYTSPHLIDVTERIRIEEADIAPEELDRLLGVVFSAAEPAPEIPLTYFEAMTAAAFVAFAERGLDLAILEVGLGGRLDATNVAPARLSIVTSIGLDHTEELGPTLRQIAVEKAGIFRAGRPMLCRTELPEAREALAEASLATGAVWHEAVEELRVDVEEVSLEGTRFRLSTPSRQATLSTPLPGAHQAWNAALAVRAAELLAEGEPRWKGLPAPGEGLARVRWPGRLERVRAGGRVVLLDGCHNPEGAEALVRFLHESGLAGRCHLVFGAMADKDIESIAARLFPAAATVQLSPAASPRSASAGELARRVAAIAPDAVPEPGVAAALERALALPGSDPIIVAGSLYLVGEARAWLLGKGRAIT